MLGPGISNQMVWFIVDHVAQKKGVTTAKLAKLCGKHPTTLGRGKRNQKGIAQWPTLTTFLKVLEVGEMNFQDLHKFLNPRKNKE